MGHAPVNAVKGKQGFQPVRRAAPVPSAAVSVRDARTAELEQQAASIQDAFSVFRAQLPDVPAERLSLLAPGERARAFSGMLEVEVSEEGSMPVTDLLQEALAETPPAARAPLNRALASLPAEGEPSAQWRHVLRVLFPGQPLVMARRQGSTTHTVGFIDARWTPAVEAFFAHAGRSGCTLAGEVCDEEEAFTLHAHTAWGACYRPAEMADEE